jgi:antitoxin Phd
MNAKAMKELQLREAKSTLSSVVDAAERGEPTTITKHGRPAAVVISYEEWTRLTSKVPSFADLLLAVPELTEEELPERRSARFVREGAPD